MPRLRQDGEGLEVWFLCRMESKQNARTAAGSFDALTSPHHRITLKLMRTTINLDEDVYQAVAHLSRSSGQRLGKTVSNLIRRGLTEKPPVKRKSRRFPAFDIQPGAQVIPASRVERVIDEEGLF